MMKDVENEWNSPRTGNDNHCFSGGHDFNIF